MDTWYGFCLKPELTSHFLLFTSSQTFHINTYLLVYLSSFGWTAIRSLTLSGGFNPCFWALCHLSIRVIPGLGQHILEQPFSQTVSQTLIWNIFTSDDHRKMSECKGYKALFTHRKMTKWDNTLGICLLSAFRFRTPKIHNFSSRNIYLLLIQCA